MSPATPAEAPDRPAYQHQGRPIDADRFYAIACDPHRHVAVQACAGAGKTWMLVSRILRALLEPRADGSTVAPHEILAITFTKKAAAEMRQRLNDWLADFANGPPERLVQALQQRGYHEQSGRLPLPVAAEQLQQLQQKILYCSRPVQIRTFHSWFAALLRTAPLSLLQQLGLPSVYELLEDDAEAVAQVWPRFFERLVAAPELRADFQAAVDAHGRAATLKALETALGKRVEFALADAAGVVAASVRNFDDVFAEMASLPAPEAVLASGGPYRAAWQEAAQCLGRGAGVTLTKAGSALERALTDGDADAALAALLTASGQPRKFSDKLAGIEQVRAVQAQAQRLQSARQQQQAWLHQQRMTRLSRGLIEVFFALKRERGWIDMNDVERAAQAMLSDASLSGWLQQRLDAQVRHLLIDEFQDTSPLQWQTLHQWLESYAGTGAGEAPRVFIVGDPKQSIYRFRRAEPQVFRAAQRFIVQGLGGDLLSCDHTQRNAQRVVQAVNQVMLQAQQAGAYADFRAHTTASTLQGAVLALPAITDAEAEPATDPATDAGAGAAADAHTGGAARPAAGPVSAWRDSLSTPREEAEESRRSRECQQAARWLALRLGRLAPEGAHGPVRPHLQPGEVMVLARRRERLSRMQEALAAWQIPALQPEKASLGDAPEVKDIMALLDALISPGMDLALAQALKSPLFACSDDDLVGLALLARHARAADAAGTVHWLDLLPKAEHGSQDWKGLHACLVQWQGWLDKLPPHDALQAIYAHGDVLARFAAAAPAPQRERVLANLRALLSAALALDGGRYATPYALVRALKAGKIAAPGAAQPDAVRLLTVHGAKGLEAPLVLLLDTDSAPARAETMAVLIDWPGEAPHPQRFSFLASESQPPVCQAEALQQELAERRREELNALYVAMTRARAQLVISSNTPARPDDQSWWARLLPLAEALPPPDAARPAGGPDAGPDAGPYAGAGAGPAALAPFLLPQLPALHGTDPMAEADQAPGLAKPGDVALFNRATDAALASAGQAQAWQPSLFEPPAAGWRRLADPDAAGASLPPAQDDAGWTSGWTSGWGGAAAGQGGAEAAGTDATDASADSLDLEARLGLAMHRLLEYLPLAQPSAAAAIAWHPGQTAAVAQQFALDPAQLDEALARARRVRQGAGAWAWDATVVQWQANEVPLTVQGQMLRLDRLVQRRDSGEWWVLDYKTHPRPLTQPVLRAQLQRYRHGVRRCNPGQTVRAAFLTAQGELWELE